MAEYIGREDARNLLEIALEDDWELTYAEDRLNEIPSADAVPVVRGEWVPSDMQEGWVTCSVCKKLKFDGRMALSPDLFEEWGLNFCPNCGAKMDKEEYDE